MNLVDAATDQQILNLRNKCDNYTSLAKGLGYQGAISSRVRSLIKKRLLSLGLPIFTYKKKTVEEQTKGGLFFQRSNYQSARSAIQKKARKVFFDHNPSPSCAICGYDKHVEVCHIKSVSEFSDDVLIKEINDISNLIGLCPNHHWEFDNKILKLD